MHLLLVDIINMQLVIYCDPKEEEEEEEEEEA